ncbi:MAG: hypothetical protein HFE64_01865 [Lachnospiraceae bacterium]|nr:hypothetical protein [Lachnospiraceae bacterium]
MLIKRWSMMLIGNLLIGICVGLYRVSELGVDAFTCMNLGISQFLHMSFGTWQLIMNTIILIVIFFKARRCIGAGTIINMVGVGYMADFIYWLAHDVLQLSMTLPLQIAAILLGSLFIGLGVALYMTADMGISPYDSVPLMIQNASHGRLSFRLARMISDITVVIIGILFCLLAGGNLWMIVGIGTICNALLNGPLIQFFKTRVALPLLGKTED